MTEEKNFRLMMSVFGDERTYLAYIIFCQVACNLIYLNIDRSCGRDLNAGHTVNPIDIIKDGNINAGI